MESRKLGKIAAGLAVAGIAAAWLITGPLKSAEELADTLLAKQVARNIQLESIKQGRPATDPQFIVTQEQLQTWPEGTDPSRSLTRPGVKLYILYQDPALASDCYIALSNETGGENTVTCTPKTAAAASAPPPTTTLKPGGDSRKAQAELAAYKISNLLTAHSYLIDKPLTSKNFKLTPILKNQIKAIENEAGGKTNAIEQFAEKEPAQTITYKEKNITCTILLSNKAGGPSRITCR